MRSFGSIYCKLETVGAVYDRAFLPNIIEIRAVTDRAYSRNARKQKEISKLGESCISNSK